MSTEPCEDNFPRLPEFSEISAGTAVSPTQLEDAFGKRYRATGKNSAPRWSYIPRSTSAFSSRCWYRRRCSAGRRGAIIAFQVLFLTGFYWGIIRRRDSLHNMYVLLTEYHAAITSSRSRGSGKADDCVGAADEQQTPSIRELERQLLELPV